MTPAAAPRTWRSPRPNPARRSSASSVSWASRWPAAERQWRIAGLPVARREGEVAPQVCQLGRDRRERPGRSRARSRRSRRPADRAAAAAISAQPASSTCAASCGCTPTDASSQVARPRAPARAARRPDVPAGHEDPLDPAACAPREDGVDVRAKRSAWRWQWLSTRRIRRRLCAIRPRDRQVRLPCGPAARGANSLPSLSSTTAYEP